jgi:hypothetical protein
MLPNHHTLIGAPMAAKESTKRCSVCGEVKPISVFPMHNGVQWGRQCGSCRAKYIRGKGRTYATWLNMRRRCFTTTNPYYHYYGGRGITVCERWNKFENFLSDMGEQAEGMSLDRINNDGNYAPDNCRWVTMAEQSRNKRSNRRITINGETKILTDWCKHYGQPFYRVLYRLRHGWDAERALSTPPKKTQQP